MNFNYFRIVVTILASFSAFFAYMCRLNLSLAIEAMTYTVEPELNTTLDYHQLSANKSELEGLLNDHLAEASSSAKWSSLSLKMLHNEEHTLALMSRIKTKKTRNLSSKKKKSNLPIQPLSIEFDVSNSARSDLDEKTTASTTTTAASTSTPLGVESSIREELNKNEQEVEIEAPSLLRWDETQKNWLLATFFLGYVTFQIPAGRAAEKFGPKALFLWLAIGTGFGSLIFPFAARFTEGSILWACLVRFIVGASQASLFPASYVLLCKWLPENERSSWLAVPSASGRIGTIVMNLMVPIILERLAWDWVFYLSGFVTLFWGFLFLVLASDAPNTSGWISRVELYYIESRMEGKKPSNRKLADFPIAASITSINTKNDEQQQAASCKKVPPIDWLKMITNRPLLVLTFVMFTSEWSNMLLMIKLPGFLRQALKMDLDEISFWSSALVFVYCIHYPLSGFLASRLDLAEIDGLSSLRVRKLFEFTAHILQALSCLTIALFSHKTVVIVALFFMMVGRSTVGGGQCLMPPELSKDYPGSVMALANSISNLAGFVGPLLLPLIVSDPNSFDSWRSLWFISAALFVAGALIFCIFANNEQQDFAKESKDKTTSQANLVFGSLDSLALPAFQEASRKPNAMEIMRMDSFSRVSSEPSSDTKRKNGKWHR